MVTITFGLIKDSSNWKQYAKSGDIVLDLAGGLGGGVGAVGASKVVGRVVKNVKEVLIITIIAIGVLFIGNGYNYIWIDKRFFQSFLSSFTGVVLVLLGRVRLLGGL
jgi:hypothetical protein